MIRCGGAAKGEGSFSQPLGYQHNEHSDQSVKLDQPPRKWMQLMTGFSLLRCFHAGEPIAQ